ncbi:Metastasis suppressor protein 1 [Hypsibius exemplaris]|uniref:Metastasis suppressor protein 1 n=1 Tax=Hypsibius exemplaris TaxID=2072580 RepID=A0A1W0WAG4_HYPEX|nr:Metastasis suppressor protein 1 [Hypsibius exemplaris]
MAATATATSGYAASSLSVGPGGGGGAAAAAGGTVGGGAGGSLSHGGPSVASSLNSVLGFGIPTANGSEDHCNAALALLFQQIMNDMKGNTPVWEDFLLKSTRLHTSLKSTLVASSAFLNSFQQVADAATKTRGASKEIGKCLTRMVLRQRSIEAKMKAFTSALMENMVTPLQDKMEDWKKTCLHMDKEHAKEFKKCQQEIKKRSEETIKLQKRAKKAGQGTMKQSMYSGSGSNKALDSFNGLVDLKRQLQDKEYEAVRQAMIEERSRFCLFVSCLKPFLDEELGMLGEMVHLEELSVSLMEQSADSFQLPPASTQFLLDVRSTCSSSADALLMQDNLSSANDTYYATSSCSSGSNQWANYRSPSSSPLPEDSASSRHSKMSSSTNGNHPDNPYRTGDYASSNGNSGMGQRQRSVCSISNDSSSSYASSDVSSAYGGHNGHHHQHPDLDKTLMAPSGSTNNNGNKNTYRRCFSDNNGQSEQHYYPSSITSSIRERDVESEEEDRGNNDTLIPAGHKGKVRARRSSLSQSEDLSRHHPLSLAVRNEYYSTIRFSSISSGDSGFISHPDQINGHHEHSNSSGDQQQDGTDSLLTPTVNGSPWSPVMSNLSDGSASARRPPPVPPFNSASVQSSVVNDQQRPHTIAHHNGYPVLPARQDISTYQNSMRNPKRPPLMQDTFVPPLGQPQQQQEHVGESQTVQPKDFRRPGRPISGPPPPPPRREETIYANSKLLHDTSALPPPPDNWMDQPPVCNNSNGQPRNVNHNNNPYHQHSDNSVGIPDNHPSRVNEMTVSATIRRASKERKDDSRWNTQSVDVSVLRQAVETGQNEVVLRRRETIVDRSHRRLSQQIYGVPSSSLANRPPPPPLPIRRTPSLHQSIGDADGEMSMGEPQYCATVGPARRVAVPLPPNMPQRHESQSHTAPRSQDQRPAVAQPSDHHASMLQSLQERLRNGPRVPASVALPSVSQAPLTAAQAPQVGTWTKSPSLKQQFAPTQQSMISTNTGAMNSTAHGQVRGNNVQQQQLSGDPRNGILSDIRNGAFALRKVSPDKCRDRSAPVVRK